MSHRDDIVDYGKVQKAKRLPGISADWILNSQRRSRPAETSIVKSTKFSGDIFDENADNFFSLHPGRDNSCEISILLLFIVWLLSAPIIHRHYDELSIVMNSFFTISCKIPVTEQRSEEPWNPVQRTSSSSEQRSDMPGQLSLFSVPVSGEEPIPKLIEPEVK